MRRLRSLATLIGMVLVFSTLSVGVAFAHDVPGGATAPVGSNISDSGFENGFGNPNSNAFVAIARNPRCPLHAGTH